MIGLVRTGTGHAQVVRLTPRQPVQLHAKLAQVQGRHLFIEALGQHMHAHRVVCMAREQFQLRQHLVGETVGHDETGMPGGAAQVHQASLGQQDDALAAGKDYPVNLRLDVLPAVAAQLSDFNLGLGKSLTTITLANSMRWKGTLFALDLRVRSGDAWEPAAEGLHYRENGRYSGNKGARYPEYFFVRGDGRDYIAAEMPFGYGHYTDAMVIYRAYWTRLFRELEMDQDRWYTTPEKLFFTRIGCEPMLSARAAKRKMKIGEIPGDEPARIGGVAKLQTIRWGASYYFQFLRDFLLWK